MRLAILSAALVAAGAATSLPALAGGLDPAPVDPVMPALLPAVPVYDWGGVSAGVQLGHADAETDGAADLEGDDALAGVRAYYDHDFGAFVVGGGLQYDATDVDLEGVASVDSVLRVGARAGLSSGRNWYYATGGYALAETDAGTLDVGESDGHFVGAGYEVFLTESVTAGAEVLYHQFDDFDVEGLEADATTASLSVNFRF